MLTTSPLKNYKGTFILINRILSYCKSLKPEFTRESALAVKNSYVALRINDLATSRNAYRITIRQLESLIRLSEAIAKIHGSNKVYPAYVDEASRILRLF
jgi:DNA replication licensing factor MCM6